MRRPDVAQREAWTVLKHGLNLLGSGGLLVVSVVEHVWWLTAFSLLAIAWSIVHLRRAYRPSSS